MEIKELQDIIQQNGVVGAGGAGFPAYMKLTDKADTILMELSPEDRSHEGIFLSFQYPVEIPGVSMVNFMRAAVNEQRKYKGLPDRKSTRLNSSH